MPPPRDGRTASPCGADAYLIEPVPADRLVQVIRRFLDPGTTVTDAEAWIVTDDRGVMVEISGPGHRLLNLSARGALGRNLPAFFAGERHQVFGDIARALDGHVAQREAQMRPRDRRPFTVAYEICREPAIGASAVPRLRWTLEPIEPIRRRRIDRRRTSLRRHARWLALRNQTPGSTGSINSRWASSSPRVTRSPKRPATPASRRSRSPASPRGR